jgi:hypothetical protein
VVREARPRSRRFALTGRPRCQAHTPRSAREGMDSRRPTSSSTRPGIVVYEEQTQGGAATLSLIGIQTGQ